VFCCIAYQSEQTYQILTSPVLMRTGMNLRSTFEESIIGFWGTTAGIVLGCCWVFYAILKYMQNRRIL